MFPLTFPQFSTLKTKHYLKNIPSHCNIYIYICSMGYIFQIIICATFFRKFSAVNLARNLRYCSFSSSSCAFACRERKHFQLSSSGASTKFSFSNAQIQLGTTTCNRVKRAIATELLLPFKQENTLF